MNSSPLRLALLTVLAWLVGSPLSAQQVADGWEQVWHEVMSTDDEADETVWEENYEWLAQLAAHPLNLNRATRQELEQLPFLSAQQVMDILAYQDRYGPMRSLGELRMVSTLDYQQLALLPFFVSVEEEPEAYHHRFPSLDSIVKNGQHTLTASGRLPFYSRRGDEGEYMGYKYRHSLRYEFAYGSYVKAGLIGAQDAGEPFLAGRNRWGYDAYSYYVQLKKWGRLQSVIAGKYKVAAGMGLVLNTSFSLGKMATLQSLGRTTQTIRPHSSRSEADYFQGVAATVSLARPLSLTAFLSHRPVDATLNADGTAATLVTSGYHRTSTEMEKKYNTHQTATGLALSFRQGGWHVGANAVYTHLDRPLAPNRQTLYRRHYPHGDNFANASVDYSYTHHRLVASGETAVSRDGALATINSVSLQPSGLFSLMVLQRFYSYRYAALYAHSFGEGSRVQNESGLFLGVNWHPLRHLQLQAYADYAYFPWARYLVSQSSHAEDFLLQATWQARRWTVAARGRVRLRQRDNAEKTQLVSNNEYRARLSVAYASQKGWTSKTLVDVTRSFYLSATYGKMITEQLALTGKRWQASLSASLFDTDAWASRIYVYERQMPHEFYFPTFYGEGLRLALYAQANAGSRLSMALRLGYTNYFDRSTIGSGQQEIRQSHTTDLDMQVRWRF